MADTLTPVVFVDVHFGQESGGNSSMISGQRLEPAANKSDHFALVVGDEQARELSSQQRFHRGRPILEGAGRDVQSSRTLSHVRRARPIAARFLASRRPSPGRTIHSRG